MTKFEAMKMALVTELKIKNVEAFDEELNEVVSLILERKGLGKKIIEWESSKEGEANKELAALGRARYKELTERLTIKIKYINTLLAIY